MICSLKIAGLDRTVRLFRVVWAEGLLEARTDHDLGCRGERAWVADMVPVPVTALLVSGFTLLLSPSFHCSHVTRRASPTYLQTTLPTLPLSTPHSSKMSATPLCARTSQPLSLSRLMITGAKPPLSVSAQSGGTPRSKSARWPVLFSMRKDQAGKVGRVERPGIGGSMRTDVAMLEMLEVVSMMERDAVAPGGGLKEGWGCWRAMVAIAVASQSVVDSRSKIVLKRPAGLGRLYQRGKDKTEVEVGGEVEVVLSNCSEQNVICSEARSHSPQTYSVVVCWKMIVRRLACKFFHDLPAIRLWKRPGDGVQMTKGRFGPRVPRGSE